MTKTYPIALVLIMGISGEAQAQAPEFMMEDCRNISRLFFNDYLAQSDVMYEGQRDDGSHMVNGTIFVADRAVAFQCSYSEGGRRMVDFWTEDQSWPSFVAGGQSPHAAR